MGYIPEYSKAAEAELIRNRLAVERKLRSVFKVLDDGQTPQEVEAMEAMNVTIKDFVDNKDNSGFDISKCAGKDGASPKLTDAQEQEVKKVADDFMHKLAEAFTMTSRLNHKYEAIKVLAKEEIKEHFKNAEVPQRQIFRLESNGLDLMQVYTNHLTREALFKMKHAGLNDEQSIRATGHLIRASLRMYHHQTSDVCKVQPSVYTYDNVDTQLRIITNYWRSMKEQIASNSPACTR